MLSSACTGASAVEVEVVRAVPSSNLTRGRIFWEVLDKAVISDSFRKRLSDSSETE